MASQRKVRTVIPQTHIIHFVGGVKRTVKNVVYIEENEWARLKTMEGREYVVNKNNVLCVEILNQPD